MTTSLLKIWILTLSLTLSGVYGQTLILTEFMADNDTGIVDEHGDFSDWVEILNLGPGTANLTGWSLSDNPALPAKWAFPAGTSIPQGQYLLVFASGKFGGTNTLTQLHTNFGLTLDQGYLGLFNSAGSPVHEYNPYRVQFRDTSYGIGSGIVSPYYCTTPTPGSANATLHVPPPGFNPTSAIIAGDLSVKVTEIMYNPDPLHPSEIALGYVPEDFEFVEFYNDQASAVDLSDMEITQGIRFDFSLAVPSMIQPGEYKLLVSNRTAFEGRYGLGLPVIGQFGGFFRLSNKGDSIAIRRKSDGTPLLLLDFNDGGSWPDKADGVGASIVAIDPNNITDPMDSDFYRSSPEWWGSPGENSAEPFKDIVINEINSHSDVGLDWFEFYNRGDSVVDVGGWYVTDVNNPTNFNDRIKHKIVGPAPIPPGGYFRLTEADIGFGFFEGGDDLVVTIGDAFEPRFFGPEVDFGTADQNVTFGRYTRTDGKNDFTLLAFPTPDAVNAPPMIGPVSIVEIMYNEFGDDLTEYVILKNLTSLPVKLYDETNGGNPRNFWRLTGAADMVFPDPVTMSPNGFAILTQTNEVAFRAKYPAIPTSIPVIGPWDGKLDNSGGEVKIQRPAEPEADGSVNYISVDQVDYNDKLPWPIEPDGTGDSLVKISPAAYSKDVNSWQAGSPFSSLITPVQFDTDNDGLPDSWEFANFGSLIFTDGSANFDGDGATDFEEFIAGTDPAVGADFHAMTITRIATTDELEVPTTVAGGPGSEQRIRRYTIEYANELEDAAPAWAPMAPYVDLPATGTAIRFNAPPGVMRRYYRVLVELE